MKRKNILKVATATAVLAALGTAVYAQDKYSLKSPSGIAFSDFRGYEDWAVVSSARTDEVLKVIVANPAMIDDVDEQGGGTVAQQRLYQLIRQTKPITDRQFEIEFLDPDVEAFAFTFG
jgi:Thioredoxin like C-terminal domain